jgi:hypothetical protein
MVPAVGVQVGAADSAAEHLDDHVARTGPRLVELTDHDLARRCEHDPVHHAVQPPSTTKVCPVTIRAVGAAR